MHAFCAALHCNNVAVHRAQAAYFVGTAPAPDAVGAGAEGTATADAAGAAAGLAPGTCAAPVSGPLAAGAVTLGWSSTLPDAGRERSLEKYASASVQAKKIAAHTAVERDMKFALPVAPNKLPDAPLPNDAPMSAPLPCWISTRPIITSAARICNATTRFHTKFILLTPEIRIRA
jgi:hypothetical protein